MYSPDQDPSSSADLLVERDEGARLSPGWAELLGLPSSEFQPSSQEPALWSGHLPTHQVRSLGYIQIVLTLNSTYKLNIISKILQQNILRTAVKLISPVSSAGPLLVGGSDGQPIRTDSALQQRTAASKVPTFFNSSLSSAL